MKQSGESAAHLATYIEERYGKVEEREGERKSVLGATPAADKTSIWCRADETRI